MDGDLQHLTGGNSIHIVIKGFWTDYIEAGEEEIEDPSNPGLMIKQPKYKEIDYVTFSPRGRENYVTTDKPVSMFLDVDDSNPDTDTYQLAKNAAEIVGAAYRHWKQGEEMPSSGTPLEAWPTIKPQQVRLIKIAGIRSVEELATATPSDLMRIRMPDQRDLQRKANIFLKARGEARSTEAVAQLRQENESLKDELGSIKGMLETLMKSGAVDPKALQAVAPVDDEIEADVDALLDDGETDELELEQLRETAKSLGIDKWHVKGAKRLREEINAVYAEQAEAA